MSQPVGATGPSVVQQLIQQLTVPLQEAAKAAATKIAEPLAKQVEETTKAFNDAHPAVTQVTGDVIGWTSAIAKPAGTIAAMTGNITGMIRNTRDMRQEISKVLDGFPALDGIRLRFMLAGDAIRKMGIDTGKATGRLAELGKKSGEALKKIGSGAVDVGRDLASSIGERQGQAFRTIQKHAKDTAAQVGKFTNASKDAAKAAGGGIRSLVQLAAGYASAGLQASLAAVRTIGVAIAQRAVAIATRIWAAVQMLLNIAMSMNPIGLIIIGIMILVGLFVLAYQRSDTFRSIVQNALRKVKEAIEWVKDAAGIAFDWIRDRLDRLVDFFSGLPDRLAGYARQMWDAFRDAARGAINSVIDAWNRLDFSIHIRVPSWVPEVGGKGFDVDDIIPDIPRLAEGGLIRSRPGGVLALLGEGREDELVIPLSRVPAIAGMTGHPVTVNVYPQPGRSEYEIGRIAARELAWAAKH